MKVDPKGATEQLLYATVLIFTETGSGEKGSGTGFFFNYEMGKSFVPFLVTNKHVVNDTVAGQIGVHIANKEEWKPSPENFLINFPDFPNLWLKHPDPDVDICVAPVGEIFIWLKDQGKRVFYRACTPGMVPTQDQLEELDAVEDVLTVGYPRGLYDEEHYYPLFRRGITASHPAVDFNGKPRTVIDAACFPGSSGSPVFIHKTGAVADKSGNVNIGGGYSYLIGVLSSGPTITSTGEIKVEDIPTVERPVTYVQSMMHLGYIEKSREIMAFLETLKLENQEVPAVKL